MKVALVSPYSLTVPGGVQGQVLGLARALREHDVDVRVIGPCDGPPPEPGVSSIGRSIRLAANGSVAPIAPSPAAAARTLATLRAERPDIVHLHEPLVPGPSLTAVLGSGAPLVGTFHASGHSPAYTYMGPVLRLLARRLAVRVAVSDEARDMARRHLGGKWRIVGNGVDADRISEAAPWSAELAGPAESPEQKGAPVVLFVGRHEPRKGLSVLLDAFLELSSEATLWVVGDGPETDALRARDVAGVEWLGRVDDAELAARMRAASVVCAPSLRAESFGVVLLEAMAAGAVVVASDIDGYREVARDGREAILVPPGDVVALRQGLRRALDAGAFTSGLIEAGRARSASFSMSSMTRSYLDIYAEVLDRRASARRPV